MIITESFVFLNYPKTGSTYVREVVRELYEGYDKSLWRRLFQRKKFHVEMIQHPERRLKRISQRYGASTEHGTLSQIPQKHLDKQVYSVFRDPSQRLVSNYYYADWKNEDVWLANKEQISDQFPEFPNLSFENYLLYYNTYLGLKIKVGGQKFNLSWWASDLLKFFSRRMIDADEVIDFADWREFDENLADVRFLKQTDLALDLHSLLSECGHSASRLKFILRKERMNVSPSNKQTARNWEIANEILSGDLIFDALISRIVKNEPVDFDAVGKSTV